MRSVVKYTKTMKLRLRHRNIQYRSKTSVAKEKKTIQHINPKYSFYAFDILKRQLLPLLERCIFF